MRGFTESYTGAQEIWTPPGWIENQRGNSRLVQLSRSDIARNPKDRHGWREPSSYSVDKTTMIGPTGEWDHVNYGNYRRGCLSASMYGLSDFAAPVPSARLRSLAEVKALLKLKDQHVNLANAFGERKQAAKLFENNISQIARAAQALLRRDLKGVAKELGVRNKRSAGKTVTERWLEYQYGWKPLLSDIYGSVDALQKTPPAAYIMTVKGAAEEDEPVKGEFDPGCTGDMPYSWTGRDHTGVRVRLDYIPSNFFVHSLSSAGVTNPLALQWELLPFSFVIDWALPVGDWINALDATIGFDFKAGSSTSYGLSSREFGSLITCGGKNKTRGFTGKLDLLKIRRTKYLSSPIPTLPRLKNPVSTGHVANAMALLTQVFGRRR